MQNLEQQEVTAQLRLKKRKHFQTQFTLMLKIAPRVYIKA